MFSTLLYASLAALGAAADDKPSELLVGDPAPKLEIQEFVHGEPVKEFEKGKTYVVEFWATWCGPCRESIPHLTELQKKYKDATFLGVSIDEDTKAVKPFVDKMGDKMDYRVGIDARNGETSKMLHSWLEASYQDGIPTAYVVNGDGKVAWIGQPGELEPALKDILAGKWDLAAKAEAFKLAIAQQKEEAAHKKLAESLVAAVREKKYDEALKLADEVEAKSIDVFDDGLDPRVLRLAILVADGKKSEKALALGKTLTADAPGVPGPTDPSSIVAAIIDPERVLNPEKESKEEEVRIMPAVKLDPEMAKIVIAAADKTVKIFAGETTSSGFQIAEGHVLVARAYQAAGDKAKAAQEFKKATDALDQTARRAKEAMDRIGDAQKDVAAAGDEKK